MKFSPQLEVGTLISRYKRFLADVILDGEKITVHCPNTGRMTNCIVENSSCWLFNSNNPKRKYLYTWELATTPCGNLACVNTQRANQLIEEAINLKVIKEVIGYDSLQSEVKFGDSRFDFKLSKNDGEACYIEVKSVTLGIGKGMGIFPDAKSDRASKHLRELMRVKENGDRAMLIFCVQHTGIERVGPADEIDPVYGELLREAAQKGVEILAYRADLSPSEMKIVRSVPVVL